MFLEDLQALVQHQYSRIDILLVIVGIFSNLVIEICICMLLLFCCTTLVSELFNQLLLKLSCCLDIFSRFFIGAEIEGTLLLQVELIEE